MYHPPIRQIPQSAERYYNLHHKEKASHLKFQGQSKFEKLGFVLKKIAEKVMVVSLVIFAAALTLALWWINPTIFAVGFIAGFLWSDQVNVLIDRIKEKLQDKKIIVFVVIPGILLAGYLHLPVVICAVTALWGAYMGSLLYSCGRDVIDHEEKETSYMRF